MARIVLHIGAAKTGSSAIQSCLRSNAAALGDLGYLIPDRNLGTDGPVSGEHVFALQSLITDPDPGLLRDRLLALSQAAGPDRAVLLSAENLSNLGNHQRFLRALDGFEARVIFYVRRQDELLTSAWQQWHSKVESDFHAWLLKALTQYGHWDKVAAGWEHAVGEGNVGLRVFDRADLVQGDLLQDFLTCLGVDPATPGLRTDFPQENPSYNDIITPLVAGNRGIFRDAHDNAFYAGVGRLTGAAYTAGRRVSLLTRDQRDSVVHFYAGVNQAVCARYFPGRERLFPAVEHHRYDYLTPQQMTDRQLRFLTHMVFGLTRQAAAQ